jgi:hypothetical protein
MLTLAASRAQVQSWGYPSRGGPELEVEVADEPGIDPRATIDGLIPATDDWKQWMRDLDQAGGELAEDRKWDIAEWLLLTTRVPDFDIERASGLPIISSLPDVRSMDFRAWGDSSDAFSGNRGLLTRISLRSEAGKRTNTADLAAVVGADRGEVFGECASAWTSAYLIFDPPGFQWTITPHGLGWLDGPRESAH